MTPTWYLILVLAAQPVPGKIQVVPFYGQRGCDYALGQLRPALSGYATAKCVPSGANML